MQNLKQMNSIQALRGFAALIVVLFHVAGGMNEYFGNPLLLKIFSFGEGGVDIFFVVSGFIIMHVHESDRGKPEQWTEYMRRRLIRIYPVYWAAFLLPFFVYFFQGRIGEGQEISYQSTLLSFFLLPQNNRMILVVTWTLVYEIMFYLIFGISILNQKIGTIILGTWLISIFTFNFLGLSLPIHQVTDFRNLEFFLGMGIALALKKEWINFPNFLWKIGVFLFCCSLVWSWQDSASSHWLMAISTAFFIAGSARSHLLNQITPQWLLFLGMISYSLYLVHVPTLLLSSQLLIKLGIQSPAFFYILTLGIILINGFLFYWIVERNVQNLEKKYRFLVIPGGRRSQVGYPFFQSMSNFMRSYQDK
jgi:exopolysaccharide production protein ExoZ